MNIKHLLPLAAILVGCTGTMSAESLTEPEDAPIIDDQDPGTPGDVVYEPDEPRDDVVEPDEPAPTINPWEEGEEIAVCEVDDLVEPHVYLRKTKQLLTGLAPTQDELERLVANDGELDFLVREWVETPEFSAKMQAFFQHTLQQSPASREAFGAQIRGSGVQTRIRTALNTNLTESFARTAVRIVEQDRPFTEIADGRTWQMTTAMMAFLIATEAQPVDVDPLQPKFYKDPVTIDGVDFDENTPVAVQLEHMTFHAPLLGEPKRQGNNDLPCSDHPYTFNFRSRGTTDQNRQWFEMFNVLSGNNSPVVCNLGVQLFQESDFSDWRDVEMVQAGPDTLASPFEAPTLRGQNTLALRVPRVGFFSAPGFLSKWETNEDNSFRVTTQQTLITGLGLAFEDQDVTTPIGDEGLAAEHAAPDTGCYSCHKNLDPMRNYFVQEFSYPFYKPVLGHEHQSVPASFSFQGHSGTGNSLLDLGRHIAEHPHFAAGWTQKLCFLATSQQCETEDPEFARVVAAFEDSNFDFKTLVVELFSSSLVTGADCGGVYQRTLAPPSITRRRHLCTALSNRLGVADVCTTTRSRTNRVVDTLPLDVWARGNTRPAQPAAPSLFYAATLDTLCQKVASNVVDRGSSPLKSREMEASLDIIVKDVMGLPANDPRHAPVRQRLDAAVAAADASGANARTQLQTAFTIACNSPFVASVDF